MSAASNFVGTWSLESFRATTPEGATAHPLGTSVVGRITYHADGRMSVQLMSKDRPPLSSDDPRTAPADEVVEAFSTYIGYLGTYSVDADAREVTHHIAVASIPNWIGTNQVRGYEFGDRTLQLSTPLMIIGGIEVRSVLVWRRDQTGVGARGGSTPAG